MLKITLLLWLGALCVVQGVASASGGSRTADMEFLQKQKKIYELLLYVRQNDLIDAGYYEVGSKFNPESNIDAYENQEAVQRFMWFYKQGLLLDRNAIFTTYNYEQRMEMKTLFEMFYSAKDFQTFYKTACWARINVNHGVFTTAFTVAVFYRNDCKYMKLPPIYEVYPNLFYSSKVIQNAQDFKMGQGYGSSQGIGSSETYKIYANYSSAYMPEADSEYKLDYFMEDVDFNSFYYYYQQVFPFWLSSKYFNVPKEIRGQFYYFFYKQLMGRYYLERMSQDLGEINDFDWYKPIYPGYYSTLSYSNGVPVPQRNKYSNIPYYKYKHLQEISVLEARIMDAVDSGYFVGQEGKQINFNSQEGLGMLANVIEGNEDSCNKRFYGRYDALARDVLGFNPEYSNKNDVIPSALQTSPISMRDPAFYMLYKRIMSCFFRYKEFQTPYSQSDLQWPSVKIESVSIDKLTTFFDYQDTLINNAVSVENYKRGSSLRLMARRLRLNYKPFTFRLNVNSEKETNAVIRVFIGPYFSNIEQNAVYLYKYYKYFTEMDKFYVTLRPGSNNIQRSSSEFFASTPESPRSDMFFSKLNKAISGSEPFVYSQKPFSFFNKLPKGTPEGTPYKFFFFVSEYDEANAQTFEFPMFGKITYDGKPFGFPLDRPMYAWNYTIPNMYMKDAYIYNYYNEGAKP